MNSLFSKSRLNLTRLHAPFRSSSSIPISRPQTLGKNSRSLKKSSSCVQKNKAIVSTTKNYMNKIQSTPIRWFCTKSTQEESHANKPESTTSKTHTKGANETETTHFGFQQVAKQEKASLVGQVFSSVASSYDVMNDAMSLGIHRIWKEEFVNMLNPLPGGNYLDVAGGTGDIAYRIVQRLNSAGSYGRKFTPKIESSSNDSASASIVRPINAHSRIVVYDINQAMLDQGKLKESQYNRSGAVELQWVQGDAEKLPYEDNTFDAYTIAFGIRNCTNISQVLREAHRVLKPGGRFLCLEFSTVRTPGLSTLYDLYSFNVIPVLGKAIANDAESYQYLVESIRQFPDQNKFKYMIEEAGFKSVVYSDLSMGIACIHSGFK